MCRFSTLCLLSLAVATTVPGLAEAQTRRVQRESGPLVIQVRPRSYLDAGTVVPVGSLDRTTSGTAQAKQYLNLPPWQAQRERFGEGTLPDPIMNGPFVGARSPFSPF
jgi:hypothetical protein